MESKTAHAPKRRPSPHDMALRRGRIFAWLRAGFAYDEIAAREGLSPERVRQIVKRELDPRIVDAGADHAKLQLTRLVPALKLAGEAVAAGDVKAIVPLLKALDRFDRYQRLASVDAVDDDEARKRLRVKIQRVAANLATDAAKAEPPAGAADLSA